MRFLSVSIPGLAAKIASVTAQSWGKGLDLIAALVKSGQRLGVKIAKQLLIAGRKLPLHSRGRICLEHLQTAGIGGQEPENGLTPEAARHEIAAFLNRHWAGKIANGGREKERRFEQG